MAGEYTEAQHKATNKYRSKNATISITVPAEVKAKWQEEAEKEGLSLTKYIMSKLGTF